MVNFDLYDKDGKLTQEDVPSPIKVTGLKANTTYSGMKLAYHGKPDKSVVPDKKTTDVKPGMPVIKLTAGDKKISVEIVDGSNQGSAVKSRKIYYSDGMTVKTLDANTKTDITGLINGTEYSVQASTTNDAGESNKSTTSKATPVAPVVHVTGVSLDKSSLSIEVGKTGQLKGTVAPENANDKSISFASADTSIATVDAKTGLVTAVKVGTTDVTVTTHEGAKTAKATITVVETVEG